MRASEVKPGDEIRHLGELWKVDSEAYRREGDFGLGVVGLTVERYGRKELFEYRLSGMVEQ